MIFFCCNLNSKKSFVKLTINSNSWFDNERLYIFVSIILASNSFDGKIGVGGLYMIKKLRFFMLKALGILKFKNQ